MQPSDQIPPKDPAAMGPIPEKPGGPSQDARTMAMLAHLLGALIGFLGPLIIWLIKKDTDSFVDDQGKEALNFQLTILIGFLAAGVLTAVSCGFLFLAFVPAGLNLVFGILAALEANKGVVYRYPFAIRMIK